MLVGWLRTPAPAQPDNTPPGAYRATADQLKTMQLLKVSDGSEQGFVTATGLISVNEDQSTPVILPYTGQVTDVFVAAGDKVVRGQPLLRIASPDFVNARASLLAAQAQAASAAAQLQVARDAEARQKQIYETGGGALKDYRQAQSDLLTAQASEAAAGANLSAAKDRLALLGPSGARVSRGAVAQSSVVYTAPVSGTVATRNVAPGQFVGSGDTAPLLTIADTGRVWLVAQLPESSLAGVRVGDPVAVTTPAYPGRTFEARIDNIAASLDPVSHRLPVRATVANPDGALKPQMFADFRIRQLGAPATGILVPSSAVIHEGDTARVWVLGKGDLLWGREVTVGDSNGGFDRITSGLKPGETIVTAGALFVNEAGLGA
ncbi:efflux RND transporter periplasmic adaptor subunit [Novosphingobium profundi]|nr:efflux RND transporter periplasmic adaptor subunit [Novosphingobium profundi]